MGTITPSVGVVVVLFGLVLLVLMRRYVCRRIGEWADETDPSPAVTPYRSTSLSRDAQERSQSTGGGSRQSIPCPACGTENDREYTFCRQCVTRLSASPYG